MKKLPIATCQQYLFEVENVSPRIKSKLRDENNSVFDIIDALSSPILTFSLSWADAIPKRLFGIIPLSRMKALMKNEQLATYAECAIYMYTRTHEAPMTSEWTNIYTHVSCKTLQEWFHEDHWDNIGASKELNEWLTSKLNGLRRHIYNKRREILKKEKLIAPKTTQKKGSNKNKQSKPPSHPTSLFSDTEIR